MASSRRPDARRARRRLGWWLAALLLLGAAAAAAAAVAFVERTGIMPRALAPYVLKRTSGHNPAIVGAGALVGDQLLALDRGQAAAPPPLPLVAGLGVQMQVRAAHVAPGVREVFVSDADDARRALAGAEAGDVITFLPGRYRFTGTNLPARAAGRAGAPIVVRALAPGSVTLSFDMVEGVLVTGPYWRFENLAIEGVCGDDTYCEHAFHVVGGASHFASVNNAITDFNAHFKINGADGRFPDLGLIEANTLTNTRARRTANPVTPVDLVAASGWMVRHSVISDFVKEQGDQVSYGAFFKGAGSNNVFESNLVWCEHKLQGLAGQRIGLSLGGGATGKPYCRDSRCIAEQEHGELRANLIMACSDVGIYLNNAAASVVNDNTVLDTAGIDVRYAGSSADLDGNLIDGAIRSRNGGVVREGDNRSTPVSYAYLGAHPVRALLRDAPAADFAWRGAAPARATPRQAARLCGPRKIAVIYGAFDDFAACRASAATVSSSAAN